MPPLPEDFAVPTRPELINRYERDVRIRQPGAKVGEGTLARMDAANTVDLLLPVYANSVLAYENTTLADASLASLKEKAVAKGLPALLPASGSTGFVTARAVTGGVYIAAGKIIKDDKASLSFKCTSGKTYADGDPVPIRAIDVGPSTNLAAGTVLRWESTTPGLGELATVLEDPNGFGLRGGRNEESIDELRKRIGDAEADPAAGTNAAQVRKFAKDAATAKGIAMQEVFVHSAAEGPNTYAYCFTVRCTYCCTDFFSNFSAYYCTYFGSNFCTNTIAYASYNSSAYFSTYSIINTTYARTKKYSYFRGY